MSFSERLSSAVKKSGKTQLQVGNDAGVSAGAMYNYAVGKRYPDVDVALKLAKAAGTTLAYLVGEASDSDEPSLSSDSAGKVAVGKALATLGNPDPDALAKELGFSTKEVRDWISGKSQPNHPQLVKLFNKVAEASEPIARIFYAAAASAKPASPHKTDKEAA